MNLKENEFSLFVTVAQPKFIFLNSYFFLITFTFNSKGMLLIKKKYFGKNKYERIGFGGVIFYLDRL
jgi:hypothetical protein